MSLIITVYGQEGIVMAGDSRTTINGRRREGDKIIQDFAIHSTETANKVFLCPNNVGIALCNEASHNGRPLAGYIQCFVLEEITQETPVDQVPEKLLAFMTKLDPVPDTIFHVSGYDNSTGTYIPRVWQVFPGENKIIDIETQAPGAVWNGEIDIMVRLLKPVYLKNPKGELEEMRTAQIPWNLFTLQDSIDFVTYAIGTTRDTMRFQMRPKTVGGPIDILVLRPNEGFWVKKKTLHAD